MRGAFSSFMEMARCFLKNRLNKGNAVVGHAF